VFQQELAQLGWIVGRNVRIDARCATTNPAEIRRQAAELVALAPDVILSAGDTTVPPLLEVTRTVPIVFPVVNDPLGAGYVESLARPGGNVTGFMLYEYSIGVKWLELLLGSRQWKERHCAIAGHCGSSRLANRIASMCAIACHVNAAQVQLCIPAPSF
jgi:hypothetical protein